MNGLMDSKAKVSQLVEINVSARSNRVRNDAPPLTSLRKLDVALFSTSKSLLILIPK